MFLSSICSTLWSTYKTASGTATSSTPSISNCIPAIVPVASSTRIWSTSIRMSCPGTSSPSTRWLRSSFWVRFAGRPWPEERVISHRPHMRSRFVRCRHRLPDAGCWRGGATGDPAGVASGSVWGRFHPAAPDARGGRNSPSRSARTASPVREGAPSSCMPRRAVSATSSVVLFRAVAMRRSSSQPATIRPRTSRSWRDRPCRSGSRESRMAARSWSAVSLLQSSAVIRSSAPAPVSSAGCRKIAYRSLTASRSTTSATTGEPAASTGSTGSPGRGRVLPAWVSTAPAKTSGTIPANTRIADSRAAARAAAPSSVTCPPPRAAGREPRSGCQAGSVEGIHVRGGGRGAARKPQSWVRFARTFRRAALRAAQGRRRVLAELPMGEDPHSRGASRRWIIREVENSLRRLRTDYIDLCQVHRPSPDTDVEETLGALTDLVRAGKVRYIGSSSYSGSQIVEAQWASRERRLERSVTEQPPYSIFVRGIEEDVLPTTQRYGMGTLAYSPLAGGWLSGRWRKDAAGTPTSAARPPARFDMNLPENQRKLDVVEELAQLAEQSGLTLIELAIAFVLRHPGGTSAIIGPRTMEQLVSQLPAADVTLADDVLDGIDELVAPG